MPGPVVSKLYISLFRNLDEAVHEAGGAEPLIAELQQEAAKFDWPYLPEAIEKLTVDQVVNALIDKLIRRAHEFVHTPPAPPTT